MEREKREGRRGGGGEKMRRIIGIMMIMLVMMGCNSRVAELEKRNEFLESIANLGKGFLDVFVTFGDMVAGEEHLELKQIQRKVMWGSISVILQQQWRQ